MKGRTVIEMLSSDWKDYEDATQNQTAIIANAECIVTRNKKDFTASTLPVYTIKELFDTIS
ncbi:MAG: twitching motility protein PilT [Coprococcus comes]|nr:twitching motility protein PilT [Coprococcus comes]